MSCKSVYMNVIDQIQFGHMGIAKILLAKYTGNNKEYAFFCADPRIEAGDLVVARSKIGFEVVYVTQIIDEAHPSAKYANNWIIGRVEDMMEEFVKKHEKMSAAMADNITKASLFHLGLVEAGGFFPKNVKNLTNATKAASMGNFTIYHEEDE